MQRHHAQIAGCHSAACRRTNAAHGEFSILYRKQVFQRVVYIQASPGCAAASEAPADWSTAAGSRIAMEGADHKADGLGDYWRFLAANRPYRLLVIGEV